MPRQQFQCIAAADGQPAYLFAARGPEVIALPLKSSSIPFGWVAASADAPADALPPNVILLALAPGRTHLVVITDDKYLHVLRFDPDAGSLRELSQRCMPKRPCAIEVLPDGDTIICADKFGDVYSLPLLVADAAHKAADEASLAPESVSSAEPAVTAAPDFRPTATTLTVHTQRNRRALEAQMKQKNLTRRKEPLSFEHKLLLGHVSLLTDCRFASRFDTAAGAQRNYLITADRDEHIRISRAPPQSHIVEGYCLGHTEYISKVCPVPGLDLLVSGGGDTWLGVWHWPSFTLRKKLDLTALLRALPTAPLDRPDFQIAVSDICIVPISCAEQRVDMGVAVACERVSGVFVFPISSLMSAGPTPSLPSTGLQAAVIETPFAVLSIASSDQAMIAALDARQDGSQRLQAWQLDELSDGSSSGNALQGPFKVRELTDDHDLVGQLNILDKQPDAGPTDDSNLDTLLYGIGNLRKRNGGGAEED